jgi:hypothetical protein
MAKRKYKRFTVDINDRELLEGWYKACYPGGSGPLGMMRMLCGLIEGIAKEQGWELERPDHGPVSDKMMERLPKGS